MTSMYSTMGPVLVTTVLVGTLGLAHGVLTDRWGPSGNLEQAVAVLDRVPRAFGDWVGEDAELDTETMTRAGIKGSILRVYRNQRTAESLSVLLVCGRGGPISVHTPDVCYAGTGYEQLDDIGREEVGLGPDDTQPFHATRFGKRGGVSPTQLEIYWAWSRDGATWEAPANPRLSLARSPALYKLYVVREVTPRAGSTRANTHHEFLRQALPEIRQALGTASPQ